MAIAKRTPLYLQCLLLAGSISLVACGGSGGDSAPDNKPQDTTPNAITFTASTNAEPNAVVTSPAVAISGIDAPAPVSISGGEYSISGGAFTSVAGSITNGQTLTVRVTASDKTNTPKTVTVTVGGVSATFNVTTLADVTPDTFSFTAKTEAELGKEYTSDAITVKGIDIAVPVSITGGTYSINGGTYTSVAGTVSADQTITVKTTSGSDTESTQNVVLTVGDVNGTYAVTTIKDKTPPETEFKFPTPYTMSEATSVKVRGTATDDHAIKSVKLVVRSFNVATPEVTISSTDVDAEPISDANGVKDFSSWTATIPLTANAENEIKVIATDDRNNPTKLDEAQQVVIRQASVKSAFPDEVNPFYFFESSALANIDGRNQLLVLDLDKIWKVDLATGLRSIFIDHNTICSGTISSLQIDQDLAKIYTFCNQEILELSLTNGSLLASYTVVADINRFSNLILDKERNQLVFAERTTSNAPLDFGGKLIAFSLGTKQFSNISVLDQATPIRSAADILIDADRYLITTGGQESDAAAHKIISVNAKTGVHSVFTDNTLNSGELFSSLLSNGDTAFLKNIIKDPKNNRIFVNESLSNKILSIDPSNGNRDIFKNIAYVNADDVDTYPVDIDLNDSADYLLISDLRRRAILIIDLETREKLILSKSKNNY